VPNAPMSVQANASVVEGQVLRGFSVGRGGAGASSSNLKRPKRPTEGKAGSARVAIVSALFLVLFIATLVVGGHAAIDPLLKAATQPQDDPRGASAVVYTMPDGIFCRHVSFDNVTARVKEGPIERCSDDAAVSGTPGQSRSGFTWHNK
jgi:hypothetical protein